MKLVYYSSVLNHHQRSLCDAFYSILGDDFLFVETMPMEQQRKALGYQEEQGVPYVLKSYLSEEKRQIAVRAAIECDVLLGAVFPVEVLHERMRNNKLTFRHIETYFRRSKISLLTPRALKIAYKEHYRYRNKPLYLLCASSRVAKDVKLFGAYPDKKFKWGYFPVTSEHISAKKGTKEIKLLWVGRLIKLKKPHYAIKVVDYLKAKGYVVHLNMIGTGALLEELRQRIHTYGLENEITLCGSMPPTEVRKYMEQADIFLFTSTKEEGWGAVLNEAMGSQCAIVASGEAGSTRYLIRNNVNGLIYNKNSCDELNKKTEILCLNKELREKLATQARKSIEEEWNYTVAAERFWNVAKSMLKQETVPQYLEGPMSKG